MLLWRRGPIDCGSKGVVGAVDRVSASRRLRAFTPVISRPFIIFPEMSSRAAPTWMSAWPMYSTSPFTPAVCASCSRTPSEM